MWLKAFESDAAMLNSGKCFNFAKGRIGVFRTEHGWFAIDNTCPHYDADLHLGEVKDGCVRCPWHRWRFNLSNGVCTTGHRFNVNCYPTKVDAGFVWVDVDSGHKQK